jgi:hypothetical protein
MLKDFSFVSHLIKDKTFNIWVKIFLLPVMIFISILVYLFIKFSKDSK